jgi:Xaa-Pro aminopeptidase
MTFCIEPGVYIPGFGGIKIEDDVIVGPDGPEVISNAGRELISI